MKDDLASDARALETQSELLSLLDQIVNLANEVRERIADGENGES